MSQGLQWVDRVMKPIAELKAPTSEYNRIYEAVMRGDEKQGEFLVNAIVNLAHRGVQWPESEADERRMNVLRSCSTALLFANAQGGTTVVLGPATTKLVEHTTIHAESLNDALDLARNKGFGGKR